MTADPAIDTQGLAKIAQGMTGAQIKNIVNIAAVSAAKQNLSCVSKKCVEEALDQVQLGWNSNLLASDF